MIDLGFILPNPLLAKVGGKAAFGYYRSVLTDLDQRGAALAREDQVMTPAYIRTVRYREVVYHELVGNPAFEFSQEQASTELKANRDHDVVEAMVGQIVRRFLECPEIEHQLYAAFFDPAIPSKLDPAMRAFGVAEASRAVEQLRK